MTVKPFVDKIPENAREGNIGMLQRNVAKSLMANIESISIAINKLVDVRSAIKLFSVLPIIYYNIFSYRSKQKIIYRELQMPH